LAKNLARVNQHHTAITKSSSFDSPLQRKQQNTNGNLDNKINGSDKKECPFNFENVGRPGCSFDDYATVTNQAPKLDRQISENKAIKKIQA